MQRRPIANNLAFIQYDLAIINADHGPELVIEELLPAVFDVFRESDPVADCLRDLLSLEHTELPCLVEWQLLLDTGHFALETHAVEIGHEILAFLKGHL